ncbi:hypothetical protein L7Q46_002650 [Serratia marcescens]|nr:hypothetical protein [Serratia marcescens]
MKEELHDLADHIARSKGALPLVWQDWASEIEIAIRKLANREAQSVGYFVRHRSAWGRPSKWSLWTECSAEDYVEFCKIIATGEADAGRFYEARILYYAPPTSVNALPVAWEMRYWNSGHNMWHDWERITAEQHAEMSVQNATDNDFEFRILYDAPPAPAVNAAPDFEAWFNSPEAGIRVVNFHIQHELQMKAWEACRAAMLENIDKPAPQLDSVVTRHANQPVSCGYTLPEGFKLMPLEMTDEIGEAIAMEARCCGGIALDIYEAALAAAPEGGN